MDIHAASLENQHREKVVASLKNLAEKLGDETVHDSIAALSAVALLADQGAETHRKLADYYYGQSDWVGSVVHFEKCCSLNPADFNAMFYLACAYKNMGRSHEAIEIFNRSLSIQEYPEAMVNLASTYSAINEKQLELETLERLIATFPDFTLGHYNLGILWYGKKNLAKSIRSYRNALETNPQHGESKVAMSLALLMDKQYPEGFAMHDARWGVSLNCPVREFNRPYWYGQAVPESSSILVTLEQGFGDTLQMLRYFSSLSEKFEKISVEVQPQMQRLVTLAFPDVNVVVHGSQLPQTDFYCPIMSLPRAFGTTYDAIPGQGAYIKVPSHTLLGANMVSDPRKKIGVCWRGGMLDPRMTHRSLSVGSIKNLFEAATYAWVSLVKDLPDDERVELASCPGVVDLTSDLTDFYDTYRLISALDLVISVDTAVAHLAGAMGKPTIVILNEGYDWRWHVDDDVSAWYPGTRLLRSYKLGGSDALVPELQVLVKKMLD